MALLHRKQVILAKSESAYGSDAGPTDVDAKMVIDPSITPLEVEKLERNYLSDTLSKRPHLLGRKHVSISFGMELKGDIETVLASDNRAEIDPLIRACKFRASYSASSATAGSFGTDYVQFFPTDEGMDFTDDNAYQSVTLYYYLDGILHKVKGAVGKCDFFFAAGEIPRINFAFSGLYETAVSSTMPTAQYKKTAPPVTYAGTMEIKGSSVNVQQLTIDIGQTVSPRPSINADHGIAGFEVTDRVPVGAVNPEAANSPTDAHWLWDDIGDGKERPIRLKIGKQDGNYITVYAGSAVFDNIGYAEREGILVQEVPFSLSIGSSGQKAREFIIQIGASA